ncbi:uncharacterized protein LOC111056173 [Nilaparvata lugens]|uniref:uncharacterized protein LOC111056173 n=1 Tax=Nilaparvata lugens TaxID=108931 RepID=UPI00193E2D13|nr:uncharacterized protein LOC111056173 [Nilaparvata lugens]
MANHRSPLPNSPYHWMLPLVTIVLIGCLHLTTSAEADGDLVFDDVTSNPSPLWRKFPMQNYHYRRDDTPASQEATVDDNSFFSPVRLIEKLQYGYKRVKRGLFDGGFGWGFFGSETNNELPDSKETEPVTDLTPADRLTTLSRETRSTESDDDEDLDGNSGASSGMTGENVEDSDEITRGERIRATLRIREPYEKEFKDVNSERFKEISSVLSQAIQEVFKDFPGQKDVNVVSIS